eukprot:Skav209380  [mRNA]  locus=scaffold5200:19265:22535:+ [translate_table: standard]
MLRSQALPCSSGGRVARRARDGMENFLSSISEEHTQQLKRWRDARRAAAVAICRRAVDQALVSLRAESVGLSVKRSEGEEEERRKERVEDQEEEEDEETEKRGRGTGREGGGGKKRKREVM